MKKIDILAGSQYPVYLGHGALERLVPFLSELDDPVTSILIITDETVASLHLTSIRKLLDDRGVSILTVPSGEKAKTFDQYYRCLTFALENKLDRKSVILAFGGGAVGDLAGFVAATYMRGIRYVQIPTTILAHDSAVGGKVAINHPAGKNMVGAFYQPLAVFYDMDFLETLPPHELRSGFAEVIKHALISSRDFYTWLFGSIRSLQNINSDDLEKMLEQGIKVKKGIVSQDERENGVRAFLNFGHTLGHAIEAEAGYGKITHGEAVAAGMVFALKLSLEHYSFHFDLPAFEKWLEQLGYRIAIPESLEPEKLLERMKQDKKSIGQKLRFVLLEDIGKPVSTELEDYIVLERMKAFMGDEYDQRD